MEKSPCKSGIRIKGWFEGESSPLNIENADVGQSMEEYWANMTLSYAEAEAGSLDDFEVCGGEDDEGESDEDDNYDDEDDEDEDNYDDDDDDGIDYGDDVEIKVGGLLKLENGSSEEDDEGSDENEYGSDEADDDENVKQNTDFDEKLLQKYMTSPFKSVTSMESDPYLHHQEEEDFQEDGAVGVAGDLLGIMSKTEYESGYSDSEEEVRDKLAIQSSETTAARVAAPKKSAKDNKLKSKPLPQKKDSRLKPTSNAMGGKAQKKSAKASAFDAEMKHKVWLLSMMEKKREEEEEILQKMEKAERKRKKFKEALLERAMAKKKMQAEEHLQQPLVSKLDEDDVAPIKKKKKKPRHQAEKPAPSRESAETGNIEVTAKELGECEVEEARADADAKKSRKKLKKYHQQMLEALKIKKEEEEKKLLELLEKDEKTKEKQKKRNEKLLRKRLEKQNQEDGGDAGSAVAAGSGISAVRASRSQGGEGIDVNCIPKKPRRQRSSSASDKNELGPASDGASASEAKARPPKFRRANTSAPMVKEAERESSSDGEDEETAEEKEKRMERIKLRQAKVTAHLNAIAEQRRLAVEKERLKEERMKKRAEIRAKRVLLENAERKLMAKEDKYTNPGSLGDAMVTKPGTNTENDPPKKKITPEMAEAIANRLVSRQPKTKEGVEAVASSKPAARDFDDWKRKNSVPPTGRVFCMTGWYPCVKSALLERGWYFNPDSASPFFDLKWTLRSSDIGLESLQSFQLTNHFLKNIALTTKVGLLKSLQQLVWLADVSPNDIIPRGYDLTNAHEIQEYIDDFRIQQAHGILLGLYFKATGLERPQSVKRPVLQTPRATDCDQEEGSTADNGDDIEEVAPVPEGVVDLDELVVNEAVFEACCSVLNRHLKPYYTDHLDSGPQVDDGYAVSPLEWEIIDGYDLYTAGKLAADRPEAVDEFLQDKKDSEAGSQIAGTAKQREAAVVAHRKLRMQRRYNERSRNEAETSIGTMRPLGQEGLSQIHTILSRCGIISGSQYHLEGKGGLAKNMWIVKPAAKSRGRGIATFCDLKKLLDYVELGRAGKNTITSSHWVVQKYMENGLTIGNHKFDMRQWVLVTDWNPLTIYFYNEFYCRFSVEEYSTSEEDMDNSFVHLVNNSIGKNSDRFQETFTAENGEEVSGFMWSFDQMRSYVESMTGSTAKMEAMVNRMKDIAVWSLMCGSDAIEHRKNSWELYGLDFMLDDDMMPWLIEINSSPACDYSTPVTEKYVKKALVELLDVVLDVREWESQPKKSRSDKPDTGGWQNIYTGPFVETPASSFGTDMTVKGELLKVPKKKTQPNVLNMYSPPKHSDESSSQDIPDTAAVNTKRILKPRRTVFESASAAKNVMVKFDPADDSENEEQDVDTEGRENASRQNPNPPLHVAPSKRPVPSLVSHSREVDSTKPVALSARAEPSSSRSATSNFQDFDDSDSDDEMRKKSQASIQETVDTAVRKSKPVLETKVAPSNKKNVSSSAPDGAIVIPIKTFSMGL